jgi:hypothetical protein
MQMAGNSKRRCHYLRQLVAVLMLDRVRGCAARLLFFPNLYNSLWLAYAMLGSETKDEPLYKEAPDEDIPSTSPSLPGLECHLIFLQLLRFVERPLPGFHHYSLTYLSWYSPHNILAYLCDDNVEPTAPTTTPAGCGSSNPSPSSRAHRVDLRTRMV